LPKLKELKVLMNMKVPRAPQVNSKKIKDAEVEKARAHHSAKLNPLKQIPTRHSREAMRVRKPELRETFSRMPGPGHCADLTRLADMMTRQIRHLMDLPDLIHSS
jgi:hypothetical protein